MTGSRPADLPGDVLRRLVVLAAQWTGVSPDAVRPENVRRSVLAFLAKGTTVEELVRGAETGQPSVVEALRTAVSIGETYFFRTPDQFRLVQKLLRSRAEDGGAFRAWSAGCATGEETYSIAALLRDVWPEATNLSVLGTDHLAASIEAARAGVYRPWSVRADAPISYPIFATATMSIRQELREMVTFQVHNLLEPPPAASFDLIFCRNVLIYYEPSMVARALEGLVSALTPNGILVLGVADPIVPPPYLQAAAPAELRVFGRVAARAEARPPPVSAVSVTEPRREAPPRRPPDRFDPVALHVELLDAIERGERRKADSLLVEIRRSAPDYLAVRLEAALMHKRFGEKAAARKELRELLDLLHFAADDDVLLGPESLPVSYYRSAAQALLDGFSAVVG
jgi:chemotaxis protein methyltransferase CheR